ncbi:MAG: SDR family NAD(P)-dependent oxidoreductase, partial [Nesterenkonia sp.]
GISIRRLTELMWLEPDDVVRQALTANAQGASVCVPSRTYQALTASLRFIPDSVVQWAAERRMGHPEQSEGSGSGDAAGESE